MQHVSMTDPSDFRWRSLVDQIPAAVFMHPLERERPPFYISPRIEQITGYRPDELMSRRDFLTHLVHPEDREAMRPLGERTDITLEPFIATYRLQRKDGSWIWLYNETEIIRDADGTPLYWQGLVLDVTAQKEMELALARSEARFRALVQRSSDATMIVQDGIGFVWISPAIRNIIGYEPPLPDDHLKGKLVHPDDLPTVNRMAREVRKAPGAVSSCECRMFHADGGWRWVEIVGVNHTDNPAVNGIVYNVREITERKEAEQAMARALELQQQANEELVTLAKDRSEFLAMLAHDLRTPLTAILGLSDILRIREDIEPEVARYLGSISTNASRLSRLISEMLSAESVESRLGRIDLEESDLNALVAAAADTVEAAWPGRTIQLDLDPTLPCPHVDRDSILRALTNLMANAFTHSPDDGQVRVVTRQSDDVIAVDVIDRGIGIPEDRIAGIFDRHIRVRSHADREVEGFGLGLPIVRAIARAHGGDVAVASVEGEGSTFTFTLPVSEEQRRRQPNFSPATVQQEPICLTSDLWEEVSALLPPHPDRPKGGRPRVDDRAVICGILYTLWTGAAWADIPQTPGAPSSVTCWRRLRQWQEAGIWDAIHTLLVDRVGGADRAAWDRACP
ncbi:MAG: PAS domain S-box protein, partial [Thermomicrobiales bacterium]